MLQLINDVLDLSKIEAQKMEVHPVEVRLTPVLQQVFKFIWILASQKDIDFRISCSSDLPEVFVSDPTRLTQALINLCSNSVKFTREGYVNMDVSCDRDTKKLVFSVSDTGIGIKPEQLEKTVQSIFTSRQEHITEFWRKRGWAYTSPN